MSKIYVAGSSRDIKKIKEVAAQLEADGHTITHKWWDVILERGSANPENATHAERWRWVDADLNGVRECDTFLLVWPDVYYSHGAFFESGYARALGKRTWYLSSERPTSIFSAAFQARFSNVLEVQEALKLTRSGYVVIGS